MLVNGSMMIPLGAHGTNSAWLDTQVCASMGETGEVTALGGQGVDSKKSLSA